MKDAVDYIFSLINWFLVIIVLLFTGNVMMTAFNYANFVKQSKQIISREGGLTVNAQIAMSKVSNDKFNAIAIDTNTYAPVTVNVGKTTVYKMTSNTVNYGENIYYSVLYRVVTPFGTMTFPIGKQMVQSDIRDPENDSSNDAQFYIARFGSKFAGVPSSLQSATGLSTFTINANGHKYQYKYIPDPNNKAQELIMRAYKAQTKANISFTNVTNSSATVVAN